MCVMMVKNNRFGCTSKCVSRGGSCSMWDCREVQKTPWDQVCREVAETISAGSSLQTSGRNSVGLSLHIRCNNKELKTLGN